MKRSKRYLIALAIAAAVCLLFVAVFQITYEYPLIIGDAVLCEKYREKCLGYSHTLMPEILGMNAHAQIISVRQGQGEILIELMSFLPPVHTIVRHSDGDIPYWESGWGMIPYEH